jgi:hypothetical protein
MRFGETDAVARRLVSILTGLLGALALVACSPQLAGAPPNSAQQGGVFPLTGLPAAGTTSQRAALSVKVDNIAGARPQAGLNQADIVFDTPVEGGLTRLFAVYQSQDASLIGPIRSARPVDADLLRLLGGAIFAYSGSSPAEIAPVKANSGATLISWEAHHGDFRVLADRPSPHNVFSSTTALYAAGGRQAPATPVFTYDSAAPHGKSVQSIALRFGSASALWTWNGSRYLRTQDGSADTLVDGSQISTDNVVVLSIQLQATSIHDSLGNDEPLPVVIGAGTCWVSRDGVLVQGTWKRAHIGDPMELLDSHGNQIPLQPGRTWVELLPRPASPGIS